MKSFGWKSETRWIYYDRENYEIYERGSERRSIELVERAGMDSRGSGGCRYYEVQVSDGLWLTNKAASCSWSISISRMLWDGR